MSTAIKLAFNPAQIHTYSPEQFETFAAHRRALAAEQASRQADSFDRSDTDGFLTQWAAGLHADLERTRATLLDAHCRHEFTGLYEDGRRVCAKRVEGKFGWNWMLHEDEMSLIARRGKHYLPVGGTSRILAGLGLRERPELDLAWARLEGQGHGLGGTCYVKIVRMGDEWGMTAQLLGQA